MKLSEQQKANLCKAILIAMGYFLGLFILISLIRG